MYQAWKDILPQLWEPQTANADVSHDGLQSDFSLQCAERRARFNCICTDLPQIEDTGLFSIIDFSWLIGCISCRWPWLLAGTDWRVMWYCLALSLFWVNSCFTQQMSFVPDKDCSSDCSGVSGCAPSSLGSRVPALPGSDLPPAPSPYCGCCEHQKEPGLLLLFSPSPQGSGWIISEAGFFLLWK